MADPFAPPAAANPFQGPLELDPNANNAFGSPPVQQQQQQQQVLGYPQQLQQQQQQPPAYNQQQQQQQQLSQQQSYDPFSQPPSVQQPLVAPYGQENNALVPSQYQANPYAGLVAPTPAPPAAASASAASFDPFASPPPASQALVPQLSEGNAYPGAPPPPPQQQQQYEQIQQYHQQQQQYQQIRQYQQQPPPPPPPPPQQQQQQQQQQPPEPPAPAPASKPVHHEKAMVPAPSSGYPGAPSYPTRPSGTPDENEVTPPRGTQARNKYSGALAQNAPLGASPLPRADMVKKTGYVLSRISFRTIVMKKWKQSFWVQYGPHTMLWFRSQADFDDWLNNPYHTQAQRNFLIKLAVNFAHDLYKPNVRGYQVTQCRTKSYGTKLIRQFKLERWMDYGPTIAAAFGSNNPKEVDNLREALVACMRNTPLNGGIRATGAVRQGGPNGQQHHAYDSHGEIPSSPDDGYGNRSAGSHEDQRADQRAFDDTNSEPPAAAEPPDLLDFSEPAVPPAPALSHQTSFQSQPAYSTQAFPVQQQQQQNYPSPGTPQSQPPQYGAPPQHQPQFAGAPPGQYPVQQQQNFGPPPPMQQQYGQPQSYGGY